MIIWSSLEHDGGNPKPHTLGGHVLIAQHDDGNPKPYTRRGHLLDAQHDGNRSGPVHARSNVYQQLTSCTTS